MKRIFFILGLGLTLLACSRFEQEHGLENIVSEEICFTAYTNDVETKTERQSDGSVFWNPGDAVSLFFNKGENGGNRFVAQNTEVSAIAEFKGTITGFAGGGESTGGEFWFWGVYPYSEDNSCDGSSVTLTLPALQTAKAGTFAAGLFPTMAKSQGLSLGFYNICGGFKFTVSRDDIKAVKFCGNANEDIAGKAKVIWDSNGHPAVSEHLEGYKEVTVTAPNNGTFVPGVDYYIVFYPELLSEGFTLTFITSASKQGSFNYSQPRQFKRGTFVYGENLDARVTTWTDITSDGGGDEDGIYLGIMGFNQQLFSYPVGILDKDTKVGFDSFINDLNMKNGTLLYYSVEQAINKMQSIQLPSNLSTAAIVTFTDGLDQGSIMMNGLYSDNTEYLNALNNKIKTEKIGGQPITAYSIGIKGSDVEDVTTFRNNLAKLASSSSNATEVSSMAEVNAKFKEIAEQLSKSNYVQTINLTMPGVSNGTLVRFTFDNVSSAKNSSLYIEGTFNLSSRSLDNVKYVGLTSTSGTTIKGTVDGIFVTFTFEGVHTNNNVLIDSKFTDEWTYITSSSIWQINSEFDKDENSDIVTKRSSAVIMLVLDCSRSLANDFVTAQNNAKMFINTLFEATGGDSGSGGASGDVIYSTTPKDLTLAIWIDGVRYYLTKEDYDKANLSDAVIEGLTIISSGDSFVLSLNNVQTNRITDVATATALYADILPTEYQGCIISARWTDINSALETYGGSKLSTNYYTSSTRYRGSSYNQPYGNCINGSGGSLYDCSSAPIIRGVKPIDYNSAIYWTDPNDLKLSVIINGKREFLNEQEYKARKNEIGIVEGVAIIVGDVKFALHLFDAQSDGIKDVATAKSMYGDIIPTEYQGHVISVKWNEINSVIEMYEGSKLSTNYYTSSTRYQGSSYNMPYSNCISSSGGSLNDSAYAPKVRGVTNL